VRHATAAILWALCVSYPACSQISSGTIIVYAVTQDEAVVAADSRVKFVSGSPPDDTYCKIAAFRNHVIFATIGAGAYIRTGPADPIQSWSAIGEARGASKVGSHAADASSEVKMIADSWAKKIQAKWNSLYAKYPDLVIKEAEHGKGLLTTGIFIVAKNKHLAFTSRGIRFSRDFRIPTSVEKASCETGHLCGSGETDIFMEFTQATSQRAQAEREDWSKRPNKSLIMYVIRMVDLTIAYGPDDVGGKVDALEMTRDGKVTWKQRKCNCPESQD